MVKWSYITTTPGVKCLYIISFYACCYKKTKRSSHCYNSMKINAEEKPFLPNGRHTVTITDVEEGKSEHKGVPFFNVRFENEDGFVNHRFYDSEPGQPIIAEFLKALGHQGQTVDAKDIVGNKISLEVEERSYPDPESDKQKTVKQAKDFRTAGEADV